MVMKKASKNNRAFFSMEAIMVLLVLFVLFSWIVVLVSKTSVVQKSQQNEALAQVHAEYVIKQLKNTPREKLASEIQKGTWSFPNAPSILSIGLGALPNETIMTESEGTEPLRIKITVRWQNKKGRYQEKQIQLTVDK